MEPRDLPVIQGFDPAHWKFSVRRTGGGWLTRPMREANAPEGNMETWTRRLCDMWHFDSAAEARAAALSHGCGPDDFKIISSPRKGGDWLKLEGAFAPKQAIAA